MTVTHADAGRLAAEGLQALRSGQPGPALERLNAAAPVLREPAAWYNLASARLALGDHRGALAAAEETLALQPRFWTALLLKGQVLEALNDPNGAAGAYEAALASAPPFGQVAMEHRAVLRRAVEFVRTWSEQRAAFIREQVAAALGGEAGRRFDTSLEVLAGKRSIYRQQPQGYFFPELPCIEFFDAAEFLWLEPILAETEVIRAEFLAASAAEAGLEPYIQYGAGAPIDQWAELNHNPRWSAFHLLKDGGPVQPNAGRCPRTLQALEAAPQPDIPGRSPVAMFSLLKPRTRIPPHTGVTNARLIVHIPLIVPAGCGFRVGAETREWRVGEAFVFDDTIEHEAWNNSDEPRCVLIFDIWNPHLREKERAAVSAMYAAMGVFGQGREEGWSG